MARIASAHSDRVPSDVGGRPVTHSAWNPRTLRYDYYRAPAHLLRSGVIAPPARLPLGGALGIAPEDAARPLPAGARPVGSGPSARGMIASPRGGAALGSILPSGDLFTWAVVLGGLYLAFRHSKAT